METATFALEREWRVDAVVGYALSLSCCSPAVLGDDRAAFERALRDRLRVLDGGPFHQATEVEVTSGRA